MQLLQHILFLWAWLMLGLAALDFECTRALYLAACLSASLLPEWRPDLFR
jgi:hypothetical protein